MQRIQISRISCIYDYIQYNDRLSYIILVCLVAVFFLVEVHEIFEYENVYGAFESVAVKIFPKCAYDSIPFGRGPINWYLICAGNLGFNNTRLMPLLISTGIIPMTYLLIRKYSTNLTALLVCAALELDLTFLVFDSIPAFGQTWALFFISSAYFIRKNHILSGIFFWLACLAKILTISWLPILIWMVLKTEHNKKYNLISILSIIPAFIISIFYFQGWFFYSGFPFVFDFSLIHLDQVLKWITIAFRWEWHVMASLPVLILYYIINKYKKVKISITPYLAGLLSLTIVFLVPMFTNEGYFPYRMIPNLIMIFYSCGYSITHFITNHILNKTSEIKTK